MTRIAAVSLTLMVLISLAVGCGGGENQEDIATEVAKTWVDNSIENVSNAVVELVVGENPIVSQIAGDVLAGQVHDNVMWSYSTPKRESDEIYQVAVTASVTLSVQLPLLGTKAYVVSLPFILDVDTEAKTVVCWSSDVLSATVEEQGE